MRVPAPRRFHAAVICAMLFDATTVRAGHVNVAASGAVAAVLAELLPQFQAQTHHTVTTAFGGSTGAAPDTIPNRLARGEPIDVVILASSALDDLITQGKVVNGSRVDLVRSRLGIAIRAGAPKPDVSTVDAFKRAMLQARSIAYSTSASGVYISTDLFPRLGIADAVKDRVRALATTPVGEAVARGEAELGFQQVSELRAVAGIEILSDLPVEVQRVTVFSAGITTTARAPEAARALIEFLVSPAAEGAIRRAGLEPAR